MKNVCGLAYLTKIAFFSTGCVIQANITDLSRLTTPSIFISESSEPYVSALGTINYKVTYANYKDIHLTSDDISIVGADISGCTAQVEGADLEYTVYISNCTGNGQLGIEIAAGTATAITSVNYQGNEVSNKSQSVQMQTLAPAVSSSLDLVVDNVVAQIAFSGVNYEFDKNEGEVLIPVISSVAKNYDYSEAIVSASIDSSMSAEDYSIGNVVIPANSTTGTLSLNFKKN